MDEQRYSEDVLRDFKAQIKEALSQYPPERIRAMTSAVKSPHFEAALKLAEERIGKDPKKVMMPSLVAREIATEMIISGWTPDCESR